MSSKNQLSLALMATGVFLLFYNVSSMAKVASINGQIAQTQQEEVSNAR